MKYFTAIATLLGLNLVSVITLLYFSGISKEIEKENKILEMQILKFNKQLKINEVEFTLHSRPSYLKKLQKIYFDNNNIATIRPIAGTRSRGKTTEEDQKLEQDLLSDEKEIAEHLMLIDLGRNDLGRIAKTGSVNLTDKMFIERYSHVMHIVSNVECELKEGMSSIDVLRATFPAGTLPGQRAMSAVCSPVSQLVHLQPGN